MQRSLFVLFVLSLMIWQSSQLCADPNCKTCPQDIYTCAACKNNYYLNKTGNNCQLCNFIDSCSLCQYNSISDSVNCTQCNNRFALDTNSNTCRECSTSLPLCNKCIIDPNDPAAFLCLECDSTSVMKEGICKLCSDVLSNCQICGVLDTKDKCVSCLNNFFANSDQSGCLPCGQLISDCGTCAFQAPYEQVKCGTCSEGFDLSENKSECIESYTTKIIIGVVVGVAVLLVAGAVFWIFWQRRKKARQSNPLDDDDDYQKAY